MNVASQVREIRGNLQSRTEEGRLGRINVSGIMADLFTLLHELVIEFVNSL